MIFERFETLCPFMDANNQQAKTFFRKLLKLMPEKNKVLACVQYFNILKSLTIAENNVVI